MAGTACSRDDRAQRSGLTPQGNRAASIRVAGRRWPGCTAPWCAPAIGRRPEWGVDPIHDRCRCCDAGRVFESLIDVITASAWVYPLILGVAALDAVFPLVPSEATVIAAAALAGAGDLVLPLVLASAAGGAVIGDNVAYLLGRFGRKSVVAGFLHSAKWQARLTRAERMLRERSATIIVVSRFVPGGRTATMLSAGLVGLQWRRFAGFDLAAGVVWAGYAGLIGFAGGRAFADDPLRAWLLAFGLAAVLTLLIESGRRILRSSRRRPASRPT